MYKIGIPRAMFYYKFYPAWKTFFEELGAEVIISDPTSKKTLDEGNMFCVDEACLAVKLFMGHVNNLKEKADYIFIPRFTSISKKEYICPKFGGIPDMVRHSIPNLPKIIDTEINLYKYSGNSLITAFDIGSYVCKDSLKIKKAYNKAINSLAEYNLKLSSGLTPNEIINEKLNLMKNSQQCSLNVAIIGHSYNLYDNFFNMNIIKKLKDNGVGVTTIEMLDKSRINSFASTLDKRMFWQFGREAIGAAYELAETKSIDGIIYLMCYGCGIDGFISDYVERKLKDKKYSIPYTIITIDEHTGEAGLDTRIEAFIDMIKWKNGFRVQETKEAYTI